MNNVNALLTPGMLVRNVQQPDWGVGQVQSNISGRITVICLKPAKSEYLLYFSHLPRYVTS